MLPVTVWPNPTVAAARVMVLDTLSQIVWAFSELPAGGTVIPVAEWSAGLYVVQVVAPNKGRAVRRPVAE